MCIYVCRRRKWGGAAGSAYRCTVQLQHYPQGEGLDVIDRVKNGCGFVIAVGGHLVCAVTKAH